MRFLYHFPDANGNETAEEKAVREAAEKKKFDEAVKAEVAKQLKEHTEAAAKAGESKAAPQKAERTVPSERIAKWIEALNADPEAMAEIKGLLIKDEQVKTNQGLTELKQQLRRKELADEHGVPKDKIEDLIPLGDESAMERAAKAAGELAKLASKGAEKPEPSKDGKEQKDAGPRLGANDTWDPSSGVPKEDWLNQKLVETLRAEEATSA